MRNWSRLILQTGRNMWNYFDDEGKSWVGDRFENSTFFSPVIELKYKSTLCQFNWTVCFSISLCPNTGTEFCLATDILSVSSDRHSLCLQGNDGFIDWYYSSTFHFTAYELPHATESRKDAVLFTFTKERLLTSIITELSAWKRLVTIW